MPLGTLTVAKPKTPAFNVADDIVHAIAREPGVDPEHVFIVFKETAWENWPFGGGRLIHVG